MTFVSSIYFFLGGGIFIYYLKNEKIDELFKKTTLYTYTLCGQKRHFNVEKGGGYKANGQLGSAV